MLSTAVGEAYFFTYPPVNGAIRVGDIFQILPVPETAPQIEPKSLFGDHPAILQFTYDKSPHVHINRQRTERRKREILLLLNIVIEGGVSFISNISHNSWVWYTRGSDDLSNYTFEYSQTGYSPKEQWTRRDILGFFDISAIQKINTIDYKTYYGSYKTFSEPFSIPDSLERSVHCFSNLTQADASLFLKSSHWLSTCSNVFHHSHSLAYMSLVFAIEGLVPSPKKIGTCPECKKDQYDN